MFTLVTSSPRKMAEKKCGNYRAVAIERRILHLKILRKKCNARPYLCRSGSHGIFTLGFSMAWIVRHKNLLTNVDRDSPLQYLHSTSIQSILRTYSIDILLRYPLINQARTTL